MIEICFLQFYLIIFCQLWFTDKPPRLTACEIFVSSNVNVSVSVVENCQLDISNKHEIYFCGTCSLMHNFTSKTILKIIKGTEKTMNLFYRLTGFSFLCFFNRETRDCHSRNGISFPGNFSELKHFSFLENECNRRFYFDKIRISTNTK